MRQCDHETKVCGSPVSTQDEIDARFNVFKESKKRRNRNTETGGAMNMMESDSISDYGVLPDWINVALDESPNDGNSTYEWAFKKVGVVVDDAKYEIVYDVSRNRHYECD